MPDNKSKVESDCCGSKRSQNSPLAKGLPNSVVYTHEGKRAMFYNDLLIGRIVLINLMSIANDKVYPVTHNLARVQEYLGERLGRSVFMYSISVDPEQDSPRKLDQFRKEHGARKGWTFLTGDGAIIGDIQGRLFAHGPATAGGGHPRHDHQKHKDAGDHAEPDCSLGLIRYGNESFGIWGAVATKVDPRWIAQRVDWITPKPLPIGSPRRRGPAPLAEQNAVDARIHHIN